MRLIRSCYGEICDDAGNMTAMITAFLVLLMATLLPWVWNSGTIYTARRTSQNGSDAAVLAAAQQVADQLNAASLDWWGCIPPQTPQQIVQSYKSIVVNGIGFAQGGSGDAYSYAGRNRTDLSHYRQWVQPMRADGVSARTVAGVTIPPVRMTAHGQSDVRGSIFTGTYGVDGDDVRAKATAEVYLDRVRSWPTPCPAAPSTAIAQHYQFRWKTRLINTIP